jgi:hypothetical protein
MVATSVVAAAGGMAIAAAKATTGAGGTTMIELPHNLIIQDANPPVLPVQHGSKEGHQAEFWAGG